MSRRLYQRSGRLLPTTKLVLLIAGIVCSRTACGNDVLPVTESETKLIVPFLKSYCLDCHNSEQAEAKLDLSGFKIASDIAAGHQTWNEVIHRLEAGEMPPADHVPRPSADQSTAFVDQVRAVLRAEATRNAGDPGVVPIRRLSNAEFNYSIRDLTGVDIRPTREFPVDPANEAGFDNSAESLTLSPALMNKYLAAAREVVQYLVLKPHGFDFAPHPVMTDTDRDKYCVNRIVDFYLRQPTNYADYFFAAWKLRATAGDPTINLPQVAATHNVSPKYLATVFAVLTDEHDEAGPLQILRAQWRNLPADSNREQEARAGCEHIAAFVISLRAKLEPKVEGLRIDGIHSGAQSFVLWKNDQYAANRRRYSSNATIDFPEFPPESLEEKALLLPSDGEQRKAYWLALKRFANVFPDAFYISERGRDYVGVPRERQEKGRLLSAGFHSMMGYYRDDVPLCDLILDDTGKRELDELWQELDFVTSAPMRQYQSFVWFERTDSTFMRDAEFDFARAEDHDVTSEEMIHRLADVYLAKARRNDGEGTPLKAVENYFASMNRQIRRVEQARLEAEASHLAALEEFAARCYRRPLSAAETEELRSFYRTLRDDDALTHEEAVQDTIVSMLISPLFFYRTDLAGTASESVESIAVGPSHRAPLTDLELASRLSYFLWSSIPDAQLSKQAADGHLHEPDVLLAETRRMLQDPRSRALAVEFVGNWLGFRRFEEHNSVDRARFPQFTDELRAAMFEEPVRFLEDMIRHDGSVLDCLYADHTFVNAPLAQHYGIEFASDDDEWIRVEHAGTFRRGGLIPMSVFLTQNSPGLRTSPVKRGYWVVRRLLGEHIPAPPPNVPDLPEDESSLGELTLADALAKHREHASCAVCHNRFDAVGLIFENFGPVGELRSVDLGNRPVQTLATFPDGTTGSNLDDLRRYLREYREQDFVDTLCRRMLAFGLGRTLLLSDDLLVDELTQKLQDDRYRFGRLIESIVTSPQFLTRRTSTNTDVH